MPRFLNTTLITATLAVSFMSIPATAFAQDRDQAHENNKAAVSYHDKRHNDDHEWNSREDQAYKIWQRDKHRKDVEFNTLKPNDQQSYWDWRHTHSDAQLKIDIR